MKIHDLALAAIATTSAMGHAMAQDSSSSVQLSGRLGAATTMLNHQAGGGSARLLTDDLLESSWIRVSGVEDLGGGMAGLFRLESAVALNSGGAGGNGAGGSKFWNRQSWVGIRLPSGGGTVTLGRQYHAGSDRAIRTFDVYLLQGSSLHVVPLALFGVNRFNGNDSRVDNSIKYRLSLPGVIELGASVGASEGTVGKSYSFDLAHGGEGYELGLSYAHFDAPTRVPATGVLPAHDGIAVGGNVQLSQVKLFATVYDFKLDSTVPGRLTQKNRIAALAMDWRFSPQYSIKVAWYGDKGESLNGVAGRDGRKNTWIVSAQYLLSKQTELNAAVFENRFSAGYKLEAVNIAALNRDPKASGVGGLSAGIRHSF